MDIKTIFVITMSTVRLIFPDIPILPGIQAGEVSKEQNGVVRSVNMTLTSEKRAEQIPSVRVDVPAGLGVGPFVKLIVDQSKPKSAASNAGKSSIKTYWGSDAVVSPGQPRVEEISGAAFGSSLPASTAYWPIGYAGEKVAGADAKPAGKYTLTTNYCGSANATVSEDQTCLDPISLLTLKGTYDPSKPLRIKWVKIPRAAGYVVTAIAGNGNETINWTSSSDPEIGFDLENKPVVKDKVDEYIAKKIIQAPETSMATIPAGVFQGMDDAIITVTAIGSDTLQPGAEIDSYVLVRSMANIPIKLATPKTGDKQ